MGISQSVIMGKNHDISHPQCRNMNNCELFCFLTNTRNSRGYNPDVEFSTAAIFACFEQNAFLKSIGIKNVKQQYLGTKSAILTKIKLS